jgi:polyribonucleotide nucleotidyltransferase
MLGTKSVSVEIDGKTITFETGLLARLAQGSVCIRSGNTVMLSAATISKTIRPGIDYFPLQIEYREKFYAAGRFPGGYFKREARPSEYEILTARATDRPLRPLFQKGFFNEVQIFNQLLSAGGEEITDILSINAASASLMLSPAPFRGPIGAVRVGRVDGQFVINPTHAQMETSDMNLTYVGTRELPMMIEGDAKEVSEADILAAMKLAHVAVVTLIDAQLQLRREVGLPDAQPPEDILDTARVDEARQAVGAALDEALRIADKQERLDRVYVLRTELLAAKKEALGDAFEEKPWKEAFGEVEVEIVRRNVLDRHQRIDGRAFDELRPLSGAVGILPRTHGSSLFTRGETQSLATVTLGTKSDSQSMDAIGGGADEKRFMLHYNFPPFCVGEAGRIMGPGRREVGHGNLAERSLRQVMPDDYAYTVRVVSEILESNGSSSMASICAGTLALMDAGVPIKKPVAGISIGLFTAPDGRTETVVDILGAEDHCGDMDFKVAGTRDGITGFQVDLKLRGLEWAVVEKAFAEAHVARLRILDFIEGILAKPRDDIAPHAPRIVDMKIPPEKIGALIGPGGKNIRRITDTYNVQIDVEDDGSVHVFGSDRDTMGGAVREIEALTAEAEIGKIYQGTVKGVKDFGAFVEILPGKEGLVHISELADFRVRAVEDVCKVGDVMWVKCLDVDDTGRIRLSRRAALVDMNGGDAGDTPRSENGPAGDRPPRTERDDREPRREGDRDDRHERRREGGDRGGRREGGDRGGRREGGDRGGRRDGGDRGGRREGGREGGDRGGRREGGDREARPEGGDRGGRREGDGERGREGGDRERRREGDREGRPEGGDRGGRREGDGERGREGGDRERRREGDREGRREGGDREGGERPRAARQDDD